MGHKMESASPEKGALITFEGGDGSGKSTHVRFLADLLRDLGLDVITVREPGATELGEKLRDIVLCPEYDSLSDRAELLIYEAARAQLMDEVIKPALEQGKIVLCDRFTDSTLIYQGLGRGIDRSLIGALNDFATDDIRPDATLVFLCPDRSLRAKRVDRRGARDRMEHSGDDFLRRVNDGFEMLGESEDQRIRVVLTNGPHSKTARQVLDSLSDILPNIDASLPDLEQRLSDFDKAHSRKNSSED